MKSSITLKHYIAPASALLVVSVLTCLIPSAGWAAPPPPGPTSVTVVNTPTQPVPVLNEANPDLAPFQATQPNVPFVSDQQGVDVNFTVPAGKRLVIEFASGTAYLMQGRVTAFQLVTVVNGVIAAHNLTFTSIGPAGGFSISDTASQQVRLYADPGTTVAFRVQRDIGGPGAVGATISGYLVNVQ